MERKPTKKISELLQTALKKDMPEDALEKLDTQHVIRCWEQVVGETLSRYTDHYRFEKKIFYVHVQSAILRNDFFMQRVLLCKKLNAALGDRMVERIMFK